MISRKRSLIFLTPFVDLAQDLMIPRQKQYGKSIHQNKNDLITVRLNQIRASAREKKQNGHMVHTVMHTHTQSGHAIWHFSVQSNCHVTIQNHNSHTAHVTLEHTSINHTDFQINTLIC